MGVISHVTNWIRSFPSIIYFILGSWLVLSLDSRALGALMVALGTAAINEILKNTAHLFRQDGSGLLFSIQMVILAVGGGTWIALNTVPAIENSPENRAEHWARGATACTLNALLAMTFGGWLVMRRIQKTGGLLPEMNSNKWVLRSGLFLALLLVVFQVLELSGVSAIQKVTTWRYWLDWIPPLLTAVTILIAYFAVKWTSPQIDHDDESGFLGGYRPSICGRPDSGGGRLTRGGTRLGAVAEAIPVQPQVPAAQPPVVQAEPEGSVLIGTEQVDKKLLEQLYLQHIVSELDMLPAEQVVLKESRGKCPYDYEGCGTYAKKFDSKKPQSTGMPSGHSQTAAAIATYMTFQIWKTPRGLWATDEDQESSLEQALKFKFHGKYSRWTKAATTLFMWVCVVGATAWHRVMYTKCHTPLQSGMGVLAGASIGALGDYYTTTYLTPVS